MDSENRQKRVQVSVTELPEKHVSLSSHLQLPSLTSLCVRHNGKRRRGCPFRPYSFLRPWTEERKNPSTEVPCGHSHLAGCAEACLRARQEPALRFLPCVRPWFMPRLVASPFQGQQQCLWPEPGGGRNRCKCGPL